MHQPISWTFCQFSYVEHSCKSASSTACEQVPIVSSRRTIAAMEKEGLTVNGKARHDSMARGEAGAVQQGGGRFVTVACDSEVYHRLADR